MDCRSLGERGSNYNTESSSSLHQMKQKDTSSKSKKKKAAGAGGFTAGLLAGAGVGVLAGLLLAPERGTAMRKKVTESAKKYTDQVSSQVNDLMNKVNKGGGQTDAHVNQAPDLPPTATTGRVATSTTTTGTTKNSPYTDTDKRSDSDVKNMINDPRNPGSTGNTGPGTTRPGGPTTPPATGGPATPTTPPKP
ncbi:YtxH domain-containing protein [Pontibacter pamirensis]|uniref:YtxH domain-containing protein n=1 Tax=Pontibacter pamirensis TaxID=2562824 RepID=UPI001F45A075|nr:YtxH domain-containing protein [Pontibacter pamirensis]